MLNPQGERMEMTAELETKQNSSSLLFGGLLAIVAFAVFTPSGPVEGVHLILFAGMGFLMAAFPPRWRLPAWLVALGGGLILASSLSLLPREFAGTQEWREALDLLGLDTGTRISPHPGQTVTHLAGLTLLVLFALGLCGHRISTRACHRVALGFTATAGGYALLAMLAQNGEWKLLWDFEPTFGFFPNRNHSATLMAMGSLCGLGVLYHSISLRHWIAAGLAGIALGILAWALLGYCGSRAGVLLLGLGFLVWLLGLGHRYLSARMVVSVGVLGGLALVLFLASDVAVKTRIGETLETMDPMNSGRTEAHDDTPMDFRMLIYKDAAGMMANEPWTGVGLGIFQYVFPQYRAASASNARSVHPESDWLMLGAESGLIAVLFLAAIVVGVFGAAIRRNRGTRSWPLRFACLLAAAVVPFHGLFDVPGHRIGPALASLLLVGLVFRPSRRALLVPWARAAFRLLGTVVFLVSAYLLAWQGFLGRSSPLTAAAVAAERIHTLYEEDQAAVEAAEADAERGAAVSTPAVSEQGEDKLEAAIAVAEEAIPRTPLDPELHFLRGGMALYFSDLEELSERSFAIQRQLDPLWVDLPLRQATAWLPIAPEKAFALWRDALARAERLAATNQSAFGSEPRRVWSAVLQSANGDDGLLALVLPLSTHPEFLRDWTRRASPELRALTLPRVLGKGKLEEAACVDLLRTWHQLGLAADAEAFANSDPRFLDLVW